MAIKELQAYELLREEGLSDIQSVGYLLRHRKSGARIMVIANDDDNKVFHITFRTPPVDSTGFYCAIATATGRSRIFGTRSQRHSTHGTCH